MSSPNKIPNDKIIEAVKVITEAAKENPEILDRFHRPYGAGTGSNYSYYNRETAAMVKKVVDIMLADPERKDQTLLTKSFRTVSRDSLCVRCWQGFKFLIERMDPDLKYADARALIEIKKCATGVKFVWKNEDLSKIEPVATLPEPIKKSWKDSFDNFLEAAANGDIFHRKDVELDDGDMEYIRRSIINFTEFRVFKLTKNEIKIGKVI